MPFVKRGEAQINYVLEGPDGAPVLVFSNSLGTNYSMWDGQAVELQKRLRILRYDTRGHGKSAVTPGPYDIEQLANDVVGLLDELCLNRVYFCGLSMGGMIGMWLGVNVPQRLNKLILCSTAAKIGTTETWNSRIEAVRKNGMKLMASAVIERWFTPAFREKGAAAVTATLRTLEQTNPEGYAACCAAVRDFDYRDQLSKIPVPTLVISAEHDPATPPADGRYLAKHIPGAGYAELNAAHLSNIEDQGGFNHQISAFLNV